MRELVRTIVAYDKKNTRERTKAWSRDIPAVMADLEPGTIAALTQIQEKPCGGGAG
ncbi:MAG: hypothetical protein WC379_15585 [Methanoregula sp.]|jgi:hypothetical protein